MAEEERKWSAQRSSLGRVVDDKYVPIHMSTGDQRSKYRDSTKQDDFYRERL